MMELNVNVKKDEEVLAAKKRANKNVRKLVKVLGKDIKGYLQFKHV